MRVPLLPTLVAVVAVTLLAAPLALAAAVAPREDGPQPWFAPPFRDRCSVQQYGEGEPPNLDGQPDPLCVEYAKRDITLDNGGAVSFLRAEPERVAVALDKCAYWQQDHWSVQVSRGQTALVRWDGSYWFDKARGQAGARMRHLTVGGQPATSRQAARAVAPYSPELAAWFRTYGRGGDGMGYVNPFPFDPRCT